MIQCYTHYEAPTCLGMPFLLPVSKQVHIWQQSTPAVGVEQCQLRHHHKQLQQPAGEPVTKTQIMTITKHDTVLC